MQNKENEPHTRRYHWPGLSEGSYHTKDADYSPRTSLLSDDEDNAVTSDVSRVLTDTNDAEDNADGYEADGEGDNVRRTIEPCTHAKMCGTKKDDAGYEAGDEDELLGEIMAYIRRTSKVSKSFCTSSKSPRSEKVYILQKRHRSRSFSVESEYRSGHRRRLCEE